jgi:circadian clock protein KaiB
LAARKERKDSLDSYILKLYVTGRSPRAERAIANLRRLCKDELAGCYDLEIIDILEHPQLAEDERILATPTLIKQLPPPLRRVIGDLSDRDRVLLGLDLRPRAEQLIERDRAALDALSTPPPTGTSGGGDE